MTKIDFYVGMKNRLSFAYRLVRKAYRSKFGVVVIADIDVLKTFDAQLWQLNPLDFIPHCFSNNLDLAKVTPVVLSDFTWEFSSCEILVNLGERVPMRFSRYERLLEVIGNDPLSIQAARERYRTYKKEGYLIESHKIL